MCRETGARVLLLHGGVEVGSWPLGGRDRPDLAVADELARLQLVARRLGHEVRLNGACVELLALLDLVGLRDVVAEAASGKTFGQAENSEEVSVEEVVVTDDPIA